MNNNVKIVTTVVSCVTVPLLTIARHAVCMRNKIQVRFYSQILANANQVTLEII